MKHEVNAILKNLMKLFMALYGNLYVIIESYSIRMSLAMNYIYSFN